MRTADLPLLAAFAIVTGCHRPVPTEPPRAVVRVAVATSVDALEAHPRSEYLGMLRGDVETDLSFKVGGILEAIGRAGDGSDWLEGARVERGDVWARLKQEDFLSSIRSAQAKADQVARAVREAGGYKVHDDLGRRMPVIQIEIDQERANTLGVRNSQVGRIAQAAFAGVKVTELREGDHLVPVKVRLRLEERNEADKIRTLYVRSLRDQLVPMDSFSTVSLKLEYATIAHFNKMRSVTVKSFARFGELPSTVLGRARPAIGRVPLPPGGKLEFAGEAKELKQSQEEIGRVMLISLALISLAMVIQFNSVTKSLVVMLTVPLGLIGAFLGLAVTHTSLGFLAFIGIMSLAGVVVSHIIVLSDFIEEARAEGVGLQEALVQAGLVRLRAVLVSVLATVGGLIPLNLTGGELWRPLTGVHIFGLLLATALTLVVLLVLYYIFCAKLRWIR